jgi:hypothetical protein
VDIAALYVAPLAAGVLAGYVAGGSLTGLLGTRDTIPVPPLHVIISVGDVLIIMAIITLIATAMRTAPRRLVPHPHPLPEEVR